MQLDRILQSQGFGSRKECRGMVRDGLVKVAGVVIKDPFVEYEPIGFTFEIDEWEWEYAEKVYIALNKLANFECSHKPKSNDSVYELLPESLVTRGVQSVGRLDLDTTGLLLFSDDGQFIHNVSSGKKQVIKEYRATLKHAFDQSLIDKLLSGVQLVDEKLPLSAIAAKQVDEKTLELTVDQGKYHQVIRMVAAAGNRVEALHRFAVGGLSLENGSLPDLGPADWCFLRPKHLALLGYEV